MTEPTSKGQGDGLAVKWNRVRERLRAQLGEDLFTSWFARIEAERLDGGTLTLSVPTKFLKSWIKSRYSDKLLGLWCLEDPAVKRVELRVRAHGENGRARRSSNTADGAVGERKTSGAATGRDPADGTLIAEVPADDNQGLFERGTPLDRHLTFETYVVGGTNALAHAAAWRVASAALGDPVEFNPLYVHGPVGMGKTHLLSAIALEIRRRAPERKVLFLSAMRFMSTFVEACKARDTIAFKKLFDGIDVLLIDDVQFLKGQAVLQEFCHTFNVLDEAKSQIVIAGDQPPARLEALDERTRSRLSGGLVAQIGIADHEMRRSILAKRVAQMKLTDARLEVSGAILDFIARRVRGTGRELEGALNQIVAEQGLERRPITLDEAAEAIRDLVSDTQGRQIMIEDVVRAVIGHFNVTRQELMSARRHKSVVYPRQIGMYLAKTMTTRSLPEIGRKFGGRDHTTVLHAVRKIEKLIGEDPKLRDIIDTLRSLLRD